MSKLLYNKFNYQFLSYFAKKYLNYYDLINEYKIVLIDQKANYVEVKNGQKISTLKLK